MEQISIVSLKCPQCGGALQVSPEMQHFACGYCGGSVVVSRSGGTISLGLEQVLANVQRGADKTAAELAIVRLERELQVARERLAALAEGRGRRWSAQFKEDTEKFMAQMEKDNPNRPKGFFRGLFVPYTEVLRETPAESLARFEAEFKESERTWEESIRAEIVALERRLEEQRKIANA